MNRKRFVRELDVTFSESSRWCFCFELAAPVLWRKCCAAALRARVTDEVKGRAEVHFVTLAGCCFRAGGAVCNTRGQYCRLGDILQHSRVFFVSRGRAVCSTRGQHCGLGKLLQHSRVLFSSGRGRLQHSRPTLWTWRAFATRAFFSRGGAVRDTRGQFLTLAARKNC